jgi:hypothetical protein
MRLGGQKGARADADAVAGSANDAGPSRRFALLAATVALAAGLGAVIGAGAVSGVSYLVSSPPPEARGSMGSAERKALSESVAQLRVNVAALKASVEASARLANGQFSKMAERFDKIERAQAEPQARLAKMSEAIERLERRAAAPAGEVTGSVTQQAAAEAKQPPKPAVLDGWVLRDYYRGRALVEGRSGLYEVVPGAELPGVGRIETIRREDGKWIVVTPKGIITSARARSRYDDL